MPQYSEQEIIGTITRIVKQRMERDLGQMRALEKESMNMTDEELDAPYKETNSTLRKLLSFSFSWMSMLDECITWLNSQKAADEFDEKEI